MPSQPWPGQHEYAAVRCSSKCILRTNRLSLAEWSHHSSVMHSSTEMNSNRSITPWSSVCW